MPAPATDEESHRRYLNTADRRHVQQVLQQARGNKVQAAKLLGSAGGPYVG